MRILQNPKITIKKSKISGKNLKICIKVIFTIKIVLFLASITDFNELLKYSEKYSVFNMLLVHFNSMDMGKSQARRGVG